MNSWLWYKQTIINMVEILCKEWRMSQRNWLSFLSVQLSSVHIYIYIYIYILLKKKKTTHKNWGYIKIDPVHPSELILTGNTTNNNSTLDSTLVKSNKRCLRTPTRYKSWRMNRMSAQNRITYHQLPTPSTSSINNSFESQTVCTSTI